MYRTYQGECGDVEVDRNGFVTIHGYDEEADLAAIALGFDPSRCFFLLNSMEDDETIDEALVRLCGKQEVPVWGKSQPDHPMSVDWITPGDVAAIGVLLEIGADPDASDGAPLSRAIALGHKEVAQFLIDAGADVNTGAITPFRESALEAAVSHRRPEIAQALVDAGADIHWNDDRALVIAARVGENKSVHILLDAEVRNEPYHPESVVGVLREAIAGKGVPGVDKSSYSTTAQIISDWIDQKIDHGNLLYEQLYEELLQEQGEARRTTGEARRTRGDQKRKSGLRSSHLQGASQKSRAGDRRM